MAVKTAGRYNVQAAKQAFKTGSGNRIFCELIQDGGADVCIMVNGFIAFRMNAAEYDAIIRPVVGRDPGAWEYDLKDKKIVEGIPGDKFNKLLQDTAREAGREEYQVQAAPLLVPYSGGYLKGVYNARSGMAAGFNAVYLDAIAEGVELFQTGALRGLIASSNGEPFALVLPVRVAGAFCRVIRAHFQEDGAAEEEEQRNELLRQLHEAEQERDKNAARVRELEAVKATTTDESSAEEIQAARAEIAALKAEIEALKAIPAATPAPSLPDGMSAKTAAVVQAFRAIAGAVVSVKGAASAAPVVWVQAETEQAAAEIKAAGGIWSNKRAAFWCRG